jgi:hypothetical protein
MKGAGDYSARVVAFAAIAASAFEARMAVSQRLSTRIAISGSGGKDLAADLVVQDHKLSTAAVQPASVCGPCFLSYWRTSQACLPSAGVPVQIKHFRAGQVARIFILMCDIESVSWRCAQLWMATVFSDVSLSIRIQHDDWFGGRLRCQTSPR